jgi:hypothetical protein
VSWTIARPAPPAPTVSVAPAPTTIDTTATIAFDGVPGATFTCSLDGGADAPCASPVALLGLAVGTHTLSVRQTDLLGHTSSDATITWQVLAAPSQEGLGSTPSPTATPRSSTFLVQVRYRVPAACARGCRAQATLMFRGASGVRTLGTRNGVVLPHSRWARFTIEVDTATLLGVPASTSAGMRTTLTRLTVASVKPDGTRITTSHDGHITVAVSRIEAGTPPRLGSART